MRLDHKRGFRYFVPTFFAKHRLLGIVVGGFFDNDRGLVLVLTIHWKAPWFGTFPAKVSKASKPGFQQEN